MPGLPFRDAEPYLGRMKTSMLTLLLLSSLAVPQAALQYGPADVDTLPMADTQINESAREIIIELPAMEIPAGGMLRTPVHRATIPFDVSIYGFRVEVLDENGAVVPEDRLHHFNLTDPDRRELFLPLPLHIMAASKETGSPTVPRLLIGMPVPAGSRYMAAAMISNPSGAAVRLRPRLILSFMRPGKIFPLIKAYPWVMDVKFPNGGEGGRKDFELPVGKSEYSWESQPALPGTILGLGGHVHDLATAIEFKDITADKVIWYQEPQRDDKGTVSYLPPAKLYRWYRLGVHIEPSHVYRVTVYYNNTTGTPIPWGGMGAVAGLFRPDSGYQWPGVDVIDPVYLTDMHNLLANMVGLEMGHGTHHHEP